MSLKLHTVGVPQTSYFWHPSNFTPLTSLKLHTFDIPHTSHCCTKCYLHLIISLPPTNETMWLYSKKQVNVLHTWVSVKEEPVVYQEKICPTWWSESRLPNRQRVSALRNRASLHRRSFPIIYCPERVRMDKDKIFLHLTIRELQRIR